ncbi:polysaccharide lyase family protein [Actinomadura sp. NEAU-AAG7]|uniref:polysaccharide lyase family protein n=1 Tax=Actinomadura sp. NEAU-AAG7 TaxID=2839640 RepID=UPI001BE42AB2|nr:polysaccharide lyase family protein [Actinomadura sp. NEAU-AAG7]MBT2211216.1 hypothetical protein [Actinomadura sp. NEAU-AAG7]
MSHSISRPLSRRAALGTAAAAVPAAVLAASGRAAAADEPRPVERIRAAAEVGRVRLTWEGEAYHPLVDHYALYASRSRDFTVGPDTLLTKTVYASFLHDRQGGHRQDWYYRIVTVDASGARSEPSALVEGHSAESVALSAKPIARVGKYDHKSLGFALAPAGYAQYKDRFPNGVDYTYGTSKPETDWSYIQPGPADGWAGNRESSTTFRFNLDTVPAETWLSIWLIDTHATLPGSLLISANGTAVPEVKLENGATRGSLEGDATVPGTLLKPSYVELALPRAAMRKGRNAVVIRKRTGSWHVFDALGVFAR